MSSEPVFYLGTHHPGWLSRPEFADVPLFISRNRLTGYKTMPRAVGRWAMDSGGFTELKEHGRWRTSPSEFVADVRRIVEGVGRMPDFCAPQDWMCEPWVIFGKNRTQPAGSPARFEGTKAARGLTENDPEHDLDTAVALHQMATVTNLLDLRELAPDLPWMPVLQGWTLDHYRRCADLYAQAGIDLTAEPIVGLGSVCRRQATSEIDEIVATFHARGLRLHGFGVKTQGLGDYGSELASADSMAWSFAARRAEPLPGHDARHKNCANCPDWALRWRQGVLAAIDSPRPRQLALAL
ncbi:DUF7221 family queuine tRNA-ribosyltransferase-like protein [Streptomyces chilikensis]|uniref:DeoxyPurine in DNA protein A domain-containing protein n=1 Tax=Streptomyces chilikensis TaxID=1194079 RepID=A0ABV3ERG3_9ACTN